METVQQPALASLGDTTALGVKPHLECWAVPGSPLQARHTRQRESTEGPQR